MVRTHPRTIYHSPIQVAHARSGTFVPSRVRNFSPEGLCWETGQAAQSESRAFILTSRYQPGTFGLNAYRSYVAVVKWCKPAEHEASGRLWVGAQIVARSHDLFEDLHKPCDLCGSVNLQAHLRPWASFSMCGACAGHLAGLSAEVLASIQRFVSDPQRV